MVKKITLRILLLIIIVFLSNIVYKYTFYKQDLIKNGKLMDKLEIGMNNSDILYFSASPNQAYSEYDIDSRSISSLIDSKLPNYSVSAVDTGAIHAGTYKKLINLIPDNHNLKYIVVNMNYRSFGIGWIMSSLENSLAKQALFYNNNPVILNRFLQGLNYYAISEIERKAIREDVWNTENLPFNTPKNSVSNWCAADKWGGIKDPKRNLADHYIKNYAFVLDANNQRIKDFDEIVEICNQKQIPLVFNVLGENLTHTEYLVDSDLTDLMLKNKSYLIERYSKRGVIMVDNFSEIPDSCFYERDFPTEHYSFTGRSIIADNIAKEITKFEDK